MQEGGGSGDGDGGHGNVNGQWGLYGRRKDEHCSDWGLHGVNVNMDRARYQMEKKSTRGRGIDG